MKQERLREMTTIEAPTLDNTRGEPLMTRAEFDEYMAEQGGKLIFNNYKQEIADNADYRGQWDLDRTSWTGIGEIIYHTGDVRKYQGFTYNQLYDGPGRIEYMNGEIYQGEFSKGKRTGWGT